jgi:D-amino-acid dehydrogenase
VSSITGNSVGIVGGGIIGTATALSLVRQGHKVSMIDPNQPGRAACYGNAGCLNPSSVVPVNIPGAISKVPRMILDPNSPLFLRWSYLPRLLPWIIPYLSHCRNSEALRIGDGLAALVSDSPAEHKMLADGTTAAQYLRDTDYVVVYNDLASFAADAYGWSLRKHFGIEWDVVEAEAYKQMEPALAHQSYVAVRLPGHGFVSDPGRYVAALTTEFRKLGGTFVEDEVVDFVFDRDQAGVVLQSGTHVNFSTLVIAAGAWSGRLTKKLGLSVPLESERGYHVEFIEPSAMPTRPTLFASGKFIATPMDGRLRCAGVVEFGGLDMPASKGPVDFIKRQVKEIFPELRYREIRTWQGHRPALTDSLPIIDRLPSRNNVILAFGHHHVGLCSGPKTARIVADLVAGKDPGIDLAPYRADRFR